MMIKLKYIIIFILFTNISVKKRKINNENLIYLIKRDSSLLVINKKFNIISSGKIKFVNELKKLKYFDDFKNKYVKYDIHHSNSNIDSVILVFNSNFKVNKSESFYVNKNKKIKSIYLNEKEDVFKIAKEDLLDSFKIIHGLKNYLICSFCNKSLNNLNYFLPKLENIKKIDSIKIKLNFPDFILNSNLNYSDLDFNILKIKNNYIKLDINNGVFINRNLFFKEVYNFNKLD